MARKRITAPVVLLIAVALAGGAWLYYRQESRTAARAGVASVEITTGDIEEVVTAQGTLGPKDYVDVGAQVSGQVKTLAVELGADVKSGQLIAEIDPQVFQTKVQADEARLKTLAADKAQQQANVISAKQKLERNQTLMKTNAISKEVLEDAQTALTVVQAQVASYDAQIEEGTSTLEGDRANLSYTKIYAPMAGTVVAQSVREGQTVNANQTAPTIVQVANLDVMTVKAQVAEADIMKLKEGMNAYFTTLGSGDRRWNGTVRQILPSPEVINDVVLYDVLIDVENKDRTLMSGMSTQMFFVAGKAENVTLIPAAALGKKLSDKDTAAGEAYQIKVLDGRTPADRIVHIGLMDRSQAEVKDGAQAGDKVLLPVTSPVKSGQPQGGARMGGGPRL